MYLIYIPYSSNAQKLPPNNEHITHRMPLIEFMYFILLNDDLKCV